MYNIKDIISSLGHVVDDAQLARDLGEWQESVINKVVESGRMSASQARFSGTVPINLLPFEDRVEMMGRFREMIHLDDVLSHFGSTGTSKYSEVLSEKGIKGRVNRHITNIWSHLNTVKDLDDRNPYGRFLGADSNDSLIGRIYASINLQMDTKPRPVKAGLKAAGNHLNAANLYFGVGSIPRIENVAAASAQSLNLRGKSMMVFDIETAGFKPGSIREIAYQTIRYGDDLAQSAGEAGQVLLNPGQFKRGLMYASGNAVGLDDFLHKRYGIGVGSAATETGDQFLNKILPFLEKAREVDHIVGHNIDTFDISQIFQGIAGTNKYKTDEVFRSYIDETFEIVKEKSIDTLRLAREAPNLVGLKAANVRSGKATVYSIQNLLLETDLASRIGLDKISQAMGYIDDGTTKVFSKGLHFGDVDTLITTGIIEHIDDLKQVSLVDSAKDGEKELARLIEKQVKASVAITPFTNSFRSMDGINILDEADIHPRVLARMRDLGIDRINPIEQEVLLSRRLGYGLSTDSAIDAARRGVPTANLLNTVGRFDRLIGKTPDMSYSDIFSEGVRPSARNFHRYRKSIKEKGLAFAGASIEERTFATALSSITSGAANSSYANLARDSGVARWTGFDLGTIQYKTKSDTLTIPMQVLKELGILDNTDRPAMFAMSIVDETGKSGRQAVNITYKFGNEELDAAHELLTKMGKDKTEFIRVMGLSEADSDLAEKFWYRFNDSIAQDDLLDALRAQGSTRGVNVSQVYDSDGSIVNKIIELLQSVNNNTDLSDGEMLNFRLPYMDLEIDEYGKTTTRTVSAVVDVGLNDSDHVNIGRNVKLARLLDDPGLSYIDDLGEEVRIPSASGYIGFGRDRKLNAKAKMISNAKTSGSADNWLRIFDHMDQKVIPRIPKIIGGAVLATAGALLISRKREQDKFDVAFEYAGQDTGQGRYGLADYIEMQQSSGYDGYTRKMDPLATASLNTILASNSTNHTNMSWDRNNSIYGGVL